VVIAIGERADFDVAAAGLLIALSPGRLLIDVDVERRVMLFQVIDAADSKPCEPAGVLILGGLKARFVVQPA
jgi:multisubunit Na+/H+ antiporter MnhE subunit